jgi:hypothetical protein
VAGTSVLLPGVAGSPLKKIADMLSKTAATWSCGLP